MFWLMLLGIYMGWVDAVYKTSPSKAAPPHDWYAPLPKPPEFLLRPELIPLEVPAQGTAEKADFYVRFMAGSRR